MTWTEQNKSWNNLINSKYFPMTNFLIFFNRSSGHDICIDKEIYIYLQFWQKKLEAPIEIHFRKFVKLLCLQNIMVENLALKMRNKTVLVSFSFFCVLSTVQPSSLAWNQRRLWGLFCRFPFGSFFINWSAFLPKVEKGK